MPTTATGDLLVEDLDADLDTIRAPDVYPKQLQDVLLEHIQFSENALNENCKSQLSSLRERLESAHTAFIKWNAGRIEVLSTELQRVRKENSELREALGTGSKTIESKLAADARKPPNTWRDTSDEVAALRKEFMNSGDYFNTMPLPGAIDVSETHNKMSNSKGFSNSRGFSNARFLTKDPMVRVHVPVTLLADRSPPSLPPTSTLNLEAAPDYLMQPSPRINPDKHEAAAMQGNSKLNLEKNELGMQIADKMHSESPNALAQSATMSFSGSSFFSKAQENPTSRTSRTSSLARLESVKEDSLKELKRTKMRSKQLNAHVFADVEAMKEKVRMAVCKEEYNVANFYKTTGLAQRIARARIFDNFLLFIILLNAIWIGVDTNFNTTDSLYDAPLVFVLVENSFCVIFFVEWVIRFSAFERKVNCMRDNSFIFDSVLVALMIIETWVMSGLLHILGLDQTWRIGDVSILKLLRLLRLTRMARVARLLRAMPELMILIKGMGVAMKSVCYTLGLLLVILYVFGIAFTQLAKDTPIGERYFKSVLPSMNTLLNHATFLEDMPEVINAVGEESQWLRALYYLHILLASLTVLNMLVGVLVEVVSVVSAVEKEQLQVNYVKARLNQFIIEFDADNNGSVTKEEFQMLLDNVEAARALRDVGVDVVGLVDLQDYIFKENASLNFTQFMDLVLSLRGTNKATVKDIVDVRKLLMTELTRIEDKLTVMLDTSGVSRQALLFTSQENFRKLQREKAIGRVRESRSNLDW